VTKRLSMAATCMAGALLALTPGGPATTPARAAVFNPETFTLDNGLQVVVVTNRRAPVVTHWVWYKVGTADSPLGKSGLPHFLEHLMFKGTETVPPGEFSKIVSRNGGNDNAMTSQDFTAYYQTIARDRLETVMELEADRMANLVLGEDEVRSERAVVVEERLQRVDNDPGAQLGEQLNAAQFLNHPYRLPTIGWLHEIEGYGLDDARDFYETWYAPNNAVLIVVGDIDAEELRPLAEKYYGSIPAREVPERMRLKEPPQQAPRRVTLADARVRQPSLVRSYVAPSYNAGASEHAYALQVLAEVFGGGATSQLYRSLVIDRALGVSAGAYYAPTALDLSTFRVYASPRPGVDLAAIEAAVDEEIARLLKEGVSEHEVERAKRRMRADAVYARDSLGGAARTIGAALTSGRTVQDVETWPERIGAVTVEQVNAAARAVLRPEASVTGLLTPAPAQQES
jgi:zinc protease